MAFVCFDPPSTAAPVFVLSCPRSGSTLLRYLLDAHRELCCPGELVLGRLTGQLQKTLHRTLGQTLEDEPPERRRQIELEETRRLLDAIMGCYALRKGKRRWAEKSPANSGHIQAIEEVFPDAQYLCLYRNCPDVAFSCIESAQLGFPAELEPYVRRYPGDFMRAMVEHWIDQTELLLQAELQFGRRSLRVTYESLVIEPQRVLRVLFAFLRLDWDENIFERAFAQPHDPGGGDFKILSTTRVERGRIGKGFRLPLHKLEPQVAAKVDALHSALGYPPLSAGPSAFLRDEQWRNASQNGAGCA